MRNTKVFIELHKHIIVLITMYFTGL